MRTYRDKWRWIYDGTPQELGKDEGGLCWLENNWQRTQFKSYQEAVDGYKKVLEAYAESDRQNQVGTDYFVEVTLIYGPQLFIDLQMELMIEYPHLFM